MNDHGDDLRAQLLREFEQYRGRKRLDQWWFSALVLGAAIVGGVGTGLLVAAWQWWMKGSGL